MMAEPGRNRSELESTAAAMVAPPKGILAIDETVPTCSKRFAEHGIESSEDSRRAYRETLALAPGAGKLISAAILQDETIHQATSDGQAFPEALQAVGIIPGIKVDMGTRPIGESPPETVTVGLDRLPERLAEYGEMGARFSKWRAVIRIGPGLPSHDCVQANAEALGRYTIIAQETGVVPIVEPEVLME